MSYKSVLITGGAGFLGSHLADELLMSGYRVRVLGSPGARRPEHLNPEAELLRGDIRDSFMVGRALKGVDSVYHFAASAGSAAVRERMQEYLSVNIAGTAVLLEELARQPVERLIAASSMNVYGEGLCCDSAGRICERPERSQAQLQRGDWEVRNQQGEALQPLPTPEWYPPAPLSFHALTKYTQEQSCLIAGKAFGIPTAALRLATVYGPRQDPGDPQGGVLAVFSANLLSGLPPLLYEDGEQRRDFVSVHDVVQACRLALEAPALAGRIFNVGSGASYTLHRIAHALATELGCAHIVPERTGQYRAGSVRHCLADISLARGALGYSPRVSLSEGLAELADCWRTRPVAEPVAAGEPLLRAG